MSLQFIESILQWLGGVWRGARQQTGCTVGLSRGWFRSRWFYRASFLFCIGIACSGWKTLPLIFSLSTRIALLIVGTLLYVPAFIPYNRRESYA